MGSSEGADMRCLARGDGMNLQERVCYENG